MNKEEKNIFVKWLHGVFQKKGCFIIANNNGLNVQQINDLRRNIKSFGGFVKIIKNSLARIAIKGTVMEKISNLFNGQILIAYSEDPLIATKVTVDFSKLNDKIKIIGGMIEEKIVTIEEIFYIAMIPSIDKLREKFVKTIIMPSTYFANILINPKISLFCMIHNLSKIEEKI